MTILSLLAILFIFPEGRAGVRFARTPRAPPICHYRPPSVCRRPAAGSLVLEPPALFSRNGALDVELDYVSSVDEAGRKRFCFVTPDGAQSPTLHVRPGDTLNIRLVNLVSPTSEAKAGAMAMSMTAAGRCGAAAMDASSVNLHFHGTTTSPACHADEVIHTLVNSGESFDYHVTFPKAQPPGLYWYHPHVHGQTEAAVIGGASGAIVVDGIESYQPAVAGLPERTLVVRDQTVAGDPKPSATVPSTDITLNYVPVAYPALTPAAIAVRPGRREFWRVLNASAETVLDIALVYDGADQPLEVVGLDGVPVGSGDGASVGKILTVKHILIPAAARAEFIVRAPSAKVASARLVTRAVDMGPDGDSDPARTLARLVAADRSDPDAALRPMPKAGAPAPRGPSDDLADAPLTAQRKLYFSETPADPYNPSSQVKYFITVDGATPETFDPAHPPAIVTRQGAVEEWTIENRSREMHEFHIHQLHFELIKRDGAAVPPDQRQYLDTTQIPYWTGKGPYPSITVRVDFRGAPAGDLLYHCHMLDHEDGGMMAIVRVLPSRQVASNGPANLHQRL